MKTGTCPTCKGKARIRPDGSMAHHQRSGFRKKCEGGWLYRPPVEAPNMLPKQFR